MVKFLLVTFAFEDRVKTLFTCKKSWVRPPRGWVRPKGGDVCTYICRYGWNLSPLFCRTSSTILTLLSLVHHNQSSSMSREFCR